MDAAAGTTPSPSPQHPAVTAVMNAFPQQGLEVKPLVQAAANASPSGQSKVADSSQIAVHVPAESLLDVMAFLKTNDASQLDFLSDVTCVDYLRYPAKKVGVKDRYGVVYTLLSTERNHRLWVKCFANDPEPHVPSISSLYSSALWMEREVFDMFGIHFDGHPDLRRILTWDGFPNYPLRKDYPLRGRGERENYEVTQRDSA